MGHKSKFLAISLAVLALFSKRMSASLSQRCPQGNLRMPKSYNRLRMENYFKESDIECRPNHSRLFWWWLAFYFWLLGYIFVLKATSKEISTMLQMKKTQITRKPSAKALCKSWISKYSSIKESRQSREYKIPSPATKYKRGRPVQYKICRIVKSKRKRAYK